MTGQALDRLLTSGVPETSLADLVDIWRMDRIEICLPGMGEFVRSPSLGNKLRGALGHVLLSHASGNVLQRQLCDWQYTSTAEIFYGRRPHLRLGDHDSEIACPYAFQMRQLANGSLEISMNVFGRACERTSSVADALIGALCGKVSWHLLAKDHGLFLPQDIRPSHVRVRKVELGHSHMPGQQDAEVIFLSPLDAERGDTATAPVLIFKRLARRVALLAPWHGLSLKEGIASLEQTVSRMKILAAEKTSATSCCIGGHHFANRLAPPLRLTLEQPEADLLLLLKLGTFTNVGRGAALGLGRYRLVLCAASDGR